MNVIALHGPEYLQSVSFKRNLVRLKGGRNHPAARRVGADALCPPLKLEWNRPLHILGDDCMRDDSWRDSRRESHCAERAPDETPYDRGPLSRHCWAAWNGLLIRRPQWAPS